MSKFDLERLKEAVISNSESKIWEEAVKEWDETDMREDHSQTQTCVCGKERLVYLFTITNTINGNVLFPIGSTCIERFGRDDLDEKVNVKFDMLRLYNAMEAGEEISMSAKHFSRRLIKAFYDRGVFKATIYNDFDAKNDYNFMINMFNKRGGVTVKQKQKIEVILNKYIYPWLKIHVAHIEGVEEPKDDEKPKDDKKSKDNEKPKKCKRKEGIKKLKVKISYK